MYLKYWEGKKRKAGMERKRKAGKGREERKEKGLVLEKLEFTSQFCHLLMISQLRFDYLQNGNHIRLNQMILLTFDLS